jgi:glycogen operon protein
MINSKESLGQASPLGTKITDQGVNFSLFSRMASSVDLLFFDHEDDKQPSYIIKLDSVKNRTYHYWHVFVPGVKPGQLYGYRVHGPNDLSKGLRFDPTKVLLDPYGRSIVIPKG